MDFSGYDDYGFAMYRDTGDGPQCRHCDQLDGRHNDDCPYLNEEA
jgi:hypothetical protein